MLLCYFYLFFLLLVSGAVYKFTDAQGHAGFLDWDNDLWSVLFYHLDTPNQLDYTKTVYHSEI